MKKELWIKWLTILCAAIVIQVISHYMKIDITIFILVVLLAHDYDTIMERNK